MLPGRNRQSTSSHRKSIIKNTTMPIISSLVHMELSLLVELLTKFTLWRMYFNYEDIKGTVAQFLDKGEVLNFVHITIYKIHKKINVDRSILKSWFKSIYSIPPPSLSWQQFFYHHSKHSSKKWPSPFHSTNKHTKFIWPSLKTP